MKYLSSIVPSDEYFTYFFLGQTHSETALLNLSKPTGIELNMESVVPNYASLSVMWIDTTLKYILVAQLKLLYTSST